MKVWFIAFIEHVLCARLVAVKASLLSPPSSSRLVPSFTGGSSSFSSSSKAKVVRGRHQDASSIPLPHGRHQPEAQPLPVWQVGGKTRTEVLGLGWWGLGELGSALPRMPDSGFASYQPWSSMDPEHTIPKPSLCCGVPCLAAPSQLHNINNR